MQTCRHLFQDVCTPESLFAAWENFRKGKRNTPDILRFEWELEQNIFQLHRELKGKTYRHGPYVGFTIADPKLRHIHKATVRDRVVHRTIFTVLNSVFEPTFIADSFSCRVGKGTHRGVARVEKMIRKTSRNGTHTCYALKCDVKKFFDSVDHDILLAILQKRINDPDLCWLLEEIVESYSTAFPRERERERRRDEKGCQSAILRVRYSPIST
jgi:retron-type reverse transcriptase